MADEKRYDVDDILSELQGEPAPQPPAEPQPPAKKPFTLHLNLDDEYGEPVETAPVVREEQAPVHTAPAAAPAEPPKPSKKKPKHRLLRGVIYAVTVLTVSVLLAYFLIVGGLDFTGLTRTGETVDLDIPAGASTADVAQILDEKGLIDQPLVFRLYARVSGADGTWQPGSFSLTPNMGYQTLVRKLQTARKRDTATVLIPEGFTVDKIAARLEAKGVCTATEFYRAVSQVDYSADYEFIAAFSAVEQADYAARIYKLEGYLFPDTYEFYLGCSGETVVRKMLDNFDRRLDTSIRAAMKAKGYTMDELVILASIVQGEAGTTDDMAKVARVLANRMQDTATYPKLQCDSTGDYIKDVLSSGGSVSASNTAYDTYEREGLPAGAINNPGLAAIKAVLTPSEDETIRQCYFFATDYKTNITYYSKTYNQHVNICTRYGIGMYG